MSSDRILNEWMNTKTVAYCFRQSGQLHNVKTYEVYDYNRFKSLDLIFKS